MPNSPVDVSQPSTSESTSCASGSRVKNCLANLELTTLSILIQTISYLVSMNELVINDHLILNKPSMVGALLLDKKGDDITPLFNSNTHVIT